MDIKDIGIGIVVTLAVIGAIIYLPGYIDKNQITIVAFTRYANLTSVNLTSANIVIRQYQLQVPFQILTANNVVYNSNTTSFAGSVPLKYPNDNFIIKVGLGDSSWNANTITVNKSSVNGNIEIKVYLTPAKCLFTINTTNFCPNNYYTN